MSSDKSIKDLNYQIQRTQIEIRHLEKTILVKKKMRNLTAEDQYYLNKQIVRAKEHIGLLESEIRKIENEKIRSKNLSNEVWVK